MLLPSLERTGPHRSTYTTSPRSQCWSRADQIRIWVSCWIRVRINWSWKLIVIGSFLMFSLTPFNCWDTALKFWQPCSVVSKASSHQFHSSPPIHCYYGCLLLTSRSPVGAFLTGICCLVVAQYSFNQSTTFLSWFLPSIWLSAATKEYRCSIVRITPPNCYESRYVWIRIMILIRVAKYHI